MIHQGHSFLLLDEEDCEDTKICTGGAVVATNTVGCCCVDPEVGDTEGAEVVGPEVGGFVAGMDPLVYPPQPREVS